MELTGRQKIRANRANARASTGPKTAAGKARAAQNALRHGFNVPVPFDGSIAESVEAIVHDAVGEGADRELSELARRIAEAQADLNRVRSYRTRLIARAVTALQSRSIEFGDGQSPPATAGNGADAGQTGNLPDSGEPQPPRSAKRFAALLVQVLREISALDRYEKRASSRRKFAIRDFDAARAARLKGRPLPQAG